MLRQHERDQTMGPNVHDALYSICFRVLRHHYSFSLSSVNIQELEHAKVNMLLTCCVGSLTAEARLKAESLRQRVKLSSLPSLPAL